MRDLYKIIQMCEAEGAMDYCQEFDEVKAILEYCDEHVKPFKKLRFRSGNESIINELTRRFEQMFVERQLADPDSKKILPGSDQKLRKIFMFLLANTDATYKYNLRDDPDITHVVEICPLIPKFLTVALAWELALDKVFYEALTYTPCWFAFQYFEAANESLKYIDDALKLLIVLQELMKALLLNIKLSETMEIDDIDKKIIFNKLHDQAIILLRRFNTPDANKIDKMKRRHRERYWGYTVKHLLQMVLFAIDLYESKINMEPSFDVSIYKIGKNFQKAQKVKLEASSAVNNQLLEIINAVLSTLQNNVMTIKMNSFIEWAEVDIKPQVTLQQAVGEMAYNVRKRISANANFEHGVAKVLTSIEIRPKTLQERVNEATIGDILRTLDDCKTMPDEEHKVWFDALCNRGIAVFDNNECLETINEHIKFVTFLNCQQIIDCIQLKKTYRMKSEQSDGDEDNEGDDSSDESHVEDELIALYFDAVKQLNEEDLVECIKYQQKVFGEFMDGVSNQLKDFNQRVTTFFNKSTNTFDFDEFLLLCLEHPFHMWSQFFSLACNTSGYIANFCDTVRKSISFSSTTVDRLLKEAIDIGSPQYPCISEVMCELYFVLYQGDKKTDFLAKFINGHINSRLEAADYDSLVPIIKGLCLITNHGDELNFHELTAPMLAMVAIVADLSRWNLNTYSDVRAELVELCINFISETLKRFRGTAGEKVRKWLSMKVKAACKPFTQFYYQEFLIPVNEEPLSFDRFLFPNLDKADAHTILKFLEKNLVRCTNNEFKLLANNEKFQLHITEAIRMIASNVNSNPVPNAILSYRNCFSKYLNFANDILKPQCKSGSETYALLRLMLELISETPNEIYNQVFMEAESFLKSLLKSPVSGMQKYELENLQQFVITMGDCPAKDIFSQHLNTCIESE